MEAKDLQGKIIGRGADSMGYPADRTGGRKYSLDWSTYQAIGSYRPSTSPHNPTPSDVKQNATIERSVQPFGKHERNTAKIDVRKGEQRR